MWPAGVTWAVPCLPLKPQLLPSFILLQPHVSLPFPKHLKSFPPQGLYTCSPFLQELTSVSSSWASFFSAFTISKDNFTETLPDHPIQHNHFQPLLAPSLCFIVFLALATINNYISPFSLLEWKLQERRTILVHLAVITKYQFLRLGGLKTRDIYCSQFWRLEVQDQGTSMVR